MQGPDNKVQSTGTYAKGRLVYLLLVPPEKRTPQDIQDISDLFVDMVKFQGILGRRIQLQELSESKSNLVGYDLDFLKDYRFSGKFELLCSNVKYRYCNAKEIIFEQGDPGFEMYYVLEGAIGIYKHDEDPNDPYRIGQMNYITEMGKHQTIGELSLIYGHSRTATGIAHENTELLVLEKNIFDNVMNEINPNFINSDTEFLRKFDMFAKSSDTFLKRLVTKINVKKYPSHHLILRQGDKPQNVYFIKSGSVKIMRKIDFVNTKNTKYVEEQSILEDPGKYDMVDGKAHTKLIEIDVLNPGTYFAEIAALMDEPIEFTAITSQPTELYVLDSKHIVNIDQEVLQELKKKTKTYESDIEYRKQYYRNIEWDKYKKNLVNNVINNKALKKMQSPFRFNTPLKYKKPIKFYDRKDESAYKIQSRNDQRVQKLPPIYDMFSLVNPKLRSGKDPLNRKTAFDLVID